MAELTLQLTAFPERGWPRIAVAHAKGESLPSPLRHATSVASLSVLGTALGVALRPGATVGGVTLHTMAALLGYVGGAALSVELAARLLTVPGVASETISRFAAGAVLPVVVSGVFNLIPLIPMSFVLALAGGAASVHSGWVGASAMLALEGEPRKRAAAIPAGVAVGLVLLANLARTVLPR